MKHYAVAEFDITDSAWVSSYVEAVTEIVERHGGRYLARTDRVERLEGSGRRRQISLIIEWPSREAALGFYHSEEYRPYREARAAGSVGQIILVAGHDMARR